MSGTFDDVTAEQPTDTRLDNDAPWSAVKQRVTEKLAEAAEIFDAAETIHEWDDLDAWDAEYTGEGSAIAFEAPRRRVGSDQRGLSDGRVQRAHVDRRRAGGPAARDRLDEALRP